MAYEDYEDKSFKIDENYFKVIIPDLNPSTTVPIQIRWQYADKTYGGWSASKNLEVPAIARPESTNISAQWITIDSGTALQITWDAPALANGFQIILNKTISEKAIFTYSLDKTQTTQKAIISAQELRNNFAGVFVTSFSSATLKTIYIDNSTSGAAITIPPYSDPLYGAAIADSDWLITAVDKGFSVSWNAIPTTGTYWETVVYKSSTQNGTYTAVGSARNAPVIVYELNSVWIKIQHRLITGEYSALSNAKQASAYVPIVFDTTPPNEVTVNSATWSGNDLVINYTMPASDPGTRFKIVLTTGIYNGYFYDYFPATSGTFNYTITNDAIFKQLSSNQSTSYTGKFISIDSSDNPTTGTSFSTGTITNPGAGVTPTFTLTPITNGYTATWVSPSWVTYTKVWEGTTSGFTPNDSTNLVYTGSSPAIIKTLGRPDPYGRKYIKIRYFGPLTGQQSEFYSAEQFVDPIDALTADITAPSAPASGGLSATAGIDTSGTMGFNGYINLTWTAVSDTTLRGYRIRFRPYKASAPFENYSYVDSPGTGTTYRLSGLAVGAIYEVAVATYDEYNNTSSYTSYSNQTVSGTPAISNYITAGAAGFQFGSGIKDKTGSQNASAQGIYLSNSNYWYLTAANSAQFKIGGASTNYVEWDGSVLKVDGDLGVAGGTTIGGNISMKNSGASIYAGTLTVGGALNSDGFLLNSNGLAIKKGTVNLRLDTTDGGIYAEYGQIAGWTIDSSKLQRGTAGTYSGISSSGTYAFWAGSTSSGGDSAAKFIVTPAGAVTARSISIIGDGSANKLLDVGSNFWVKNDGSMYAISAEIEGTIRATAGVFKGQVDIGNDTNTAGVLRVQSGTGTILIGKNALIDGTTTAAITASSGSTTNFYVRASDGYMFSQSGKIGGWTIGTSSLSAGGGASAIGLSASSTAGAYAFWAGAGTPDTNTPFSVTNTGVLRATGAIISGQISVTSGRIGNQTTGWNINAGQLESYGTPAGSTQLILNSATGTISGGLISGVKIEGSQLGVYGSPGASGATTVTEPSPSGDDDSGVTGSTGTSGANGTNVTLTIRDGEINSDKSLLIKSTSSTEIWSGGAQSAAFTSSGHSIMIPGSNGLYIGNSSNSQGAAASAHPAYITIDGRMRLRVGAPLFYPNGSTGAYIRNIYIKQTTSNPASTTGHIGDVFITY